MDIVDDVRGRLRIRLLGIDTPETKKPGYTIGCWGPEASEFAKSTLLGQRVAFVTDPSQGIYDRYGRPWPTWTRPTVGTTRSKRPVRVRPIPTSITAIPQPEPTRLQLPNRKRRPPAGACGDHRASAKRPQSQSDSPRVRLRPTVSLCNPSCIQRLCSRTVQRRSGRSPQPSPPYSQSPQLGLEG